MSVAISKPAKKNTLADMTKRKQSTHAWARAALSFWLRRWYAQAAEKIEQEAQARAEELRRLAR